MKRISTLFLYNFFLIAGISGFAQTHYEVINLGTLPGGNSSEAWDINNNGQIAGRSSIPGSTRGFIWQNGNMVNLGTLGGTYSEAKAINSAGQVVGVAENGNGKSKAFLWQNGTMTDLGKLQVDQNSVAYGINEFLKIVGVGEYKENIGGGRAFLWENGSMIDLIGIQSVANDINNFDKVVGVYQTINGGIAFLWDNGKFASLGTLGGNYSEATSINDLSQIVGISYDINFNATAFLWQDSSMISIGSLGVSSKAHDINNIGQIVGESQLTTGPHAWIWEDGTMTDLNSLIDANSGWTLYSATAINDSGQIVGYGTSSQGIRAFLLNPIKFNIIEPTQSEVWIAGETDTIKWTGVDSVNIFLSINYENGNGTFQPIVENYNSDLGKYIWQIPDTILSRKCVIKIVDAIDTSTNVKSGIFRIKPYVITRILPDSTYEVFKPSEDGWQMLNDTTDIWPGIWWSQFDYSGIDEITGNPYPAYFTDPPMSAQPKDFPDWPLFVEQFGVNQTYWINQGIPKSSASIKWRNSKGDWGGSCYGFATSSLLAFAYKDEFLTRHPGIPNFTNLYDLFINTTSRKAINGYYTHQFGQADHQNYLASRNKTPRQTLQELKDLFKMETPDSVKAISFFNIGGSGGHTVVPYKLERFGQSNLVYVYDSNNPGDNNAFIEIDSLNNTWEEFLGLNWAAGNNHFYLEIPAVRYFTPPVLGRKSAPPRSSFIEGTTLIGCDIYNNISIKNSTSDSIGYYNGLSFNSFTDAAAIIPKTGRNHPPTGYILPDDSYNLTLNSFDSLSAFVSFIKDSTIYIYSREDAELNQTDQIKFNDNLKVYSADISEKNLNLQLLLDSFNNEKVFEVNVLEAVQGDSINLSEIYGEELLFKNYGDVKNYELEIRYVSSSGIYNFGNYSIIIAGNSAHQVVPDWNDLQNQPVKILIDLGNDGTIDDSIFVKNQSTDVDDEGSLLSPDSYNLAQNYPNPFNPVTTIQYSIPKRSNVLLKVYDIIGNEVITLVNEEKGRGVYTITFDASQLASGIYFYKIQAGNFIAVKKMMLLK
jgi:probable HAF family extracellular repeat protein